MSDNIELGEFIRSVLEQVEDNSDLAGLVEFEVTVLDAVKAGAGLHIYIGKAGAETQTQNTTTIRFKAGPKDHKDKWFSHGSNQGIISDIE